MFTRFTRMAIAVLVVSFLFIGCSKKTDSKYFVRFKLNGNWVTMKNVLGEIGPDLADPDLLDFGINGNSEDHKEIFDISLQTGSDHFEVGKVYNSEDWFMPVGYTTDVNGNDMQSYDNFNGKDGMDFPYFTLTFTVITDKEVKGTFTGNYLYDYFDEELVTVTEGEFYAPRIR
jgi:hypothetical protein